MPVGQVSRHLYDLFKMNVTAAVERDDHFVPNFDDIKRFSLILFNFAIKYLREALLELLRVYEVSIRFVGVLFVEVLVQVLQADELFLKSFDLLLDVEYPRDKKLLVGNL